MVCYPEIFNRSPALEISTGKICSQFLTCSHFLDSNLFFLLCYVFQLNLDITVDPPQDLRLRLKGYDLRSGLLKGAETFTLQHTLNFENERKLVLTTFKCVEKEISLANLLGTGHYLSPGGGRILGGNT